MKPSRCCSPPWRPAWNPCCRRLADRRDQTGAPGGAPARPCLRGPRQCRCGGPAAGGPGQRPLCGSRQPCPGRGGWGAGHAVLALPCRAQTPPASALIPAVGSTRRVRHALTTGFADRRVPEEWADMPAPPHHRALKPAAWSATMAEETVSAIPLSDGAGPGNGGEHQDGPSLCINGPTSRRGGRRQRASGPLQEKTFRKEDLSGSMQRMHRSTGELTCHS